MAFLAISLPRSLSLSLFFLPWRRGWPWPLRCLQRLEREGFDDSECTPTCRGRGGTRRRTAGDQDGLALETGGVEERGGHGSEGVGDRALSVGGEEGRESGGDEASSEHPLTETDETLVVGWVGRREGAREEESVVVEPEKDDKGEWRWTPPDRPLPTCPPPIAGRARPIEEEEEREIACS